MVSLLICIDWSQFWWENKCSEKNIDCGFQNHLYVNHRARNIKMHPPPKKQKQNKTKLKTKKKDKKGMKPKKNPDVQLIGPCTLLIQ